VANDQHASQDKEPQRVLGVPIDFFSTRSSQGEEPQRVLGFPVGALGLGNGDDDWLAHPIRAYKRRMSRRREGPHAD
jgi:hypothetical protein